MKLPPLVTTLAPLSGEELTRYSRHILLPEIGLTGQQRLKAARVLVVGAGGLGSPALLYLAAAGVGTLGVIDFDRVDVSNLQRQVIHRMSTVGMPKTVSARNAIIALNPHVDVRLHDERLDNDNAIPLLSQYDLILDGTDNFATRYLVNDACVLAGKPYVWGSIYRFEGQASVF
ncbi:TPA: ThiF family adenylyltransferase [Burkholderia multivorans]|nr:ThiF family adenylyltransferase [Burkholderia multivorans]